MEAAREQATVDTAATAGGQRLAAGDPIPTLVAATLASPRFALDAAAGRYLVIACLGANASLAEAVVAALAARADLFDDRHASAFTVSADPAGAGRTERRGLRHFSDPDGSAARRFGVGDEGAILLVDPSLRLLAAFPLADIAGAVDTVAGLPPPERHAGIALAPPVLVLPRLFEPALCARLIGAYTAAGGEMSGFMREIDGKTVGVHDRRHKSRRDHLLEDPALKREVQARVVRVVLPMMLKCFQYRATRMERYLVACYDAAEGGHFNAHRDNTTSGTAHRRFAMSVNLNDGFEGGDIWFPEFSREPLRPPPGGAVIFSCSLLHAVRPITRGQRYAFLPFFYDEGAAAIRREANARLGDNVGTYVERRAGADAPA
jgi:predicted 2-oxoglutarate/Fe(II)-dependent dioxygenase YbiX